jgi:predicted Zn-dependent peptidase
MWDPYTNFERIVLPNGLTVFASQVDREFEIFGFIVHAGSREDLIERDGTAHFVEHCVSENVAGYPNSKDITSHFEKQGGFAKLGTTGYLKTSYMCKCQATIEQINKALDIFGKMLISSQILKDIETERNIIIQEYHVRYPYKFASELDLYRHACIFPNHRLNNYQSPIGKIDEIEAMTKGNLQRFYDRFYTPANISVVAIGKLSLESVAEFLEKSPFGQPKSGKRTATEKTRTPDYSAITRFDIKASLLLGETNLRTRGHYESYAALPGALNAESVSFTKNLLQKILGQEIREKMGWAYQVQIGLNYLQDLYELYLEIPLKIKALPHIEELVERCISTALNEEDIFHEMQEIAVNELVLEDCSCERICELSMLDIVRTERIVSHYEINQLRKAITPNDIKNVLNYLKPEKRFTIITHP